MKHRATPRFWLAIAHFPWKCSSLRIEATSSYAVILATQRFI
jgi:hypothetical protein